MLFERSIVDMEISWCGGSWVRERERWRERVREMEMERESGRIREMERERGRIRERVR